MIKVLIIDDHPITVDGTKIILTGHFKSSITIKTAETKSSTLSMLNEKFDLVISDVMIPNNEFEKAYEFNGIDLASYIKRTHPDTKLIMLTMLKDERMLKKLIDIGVNSIVLKSMDEDILIKAVKSVMNGNNFFEKQLQSLLVSKKAEKKNVPHNIILSPYEEQVLKYTAHGLKEKEIALKIGKSTRTVERHIKTLKLKFEASNKENLVFKATKIGLL
ncbi:MAG: response regulator transcription factor [Bacteroidales bacterium]|nr:response regulator transcription factor [Bacteroidales bacterium]